MEELLENETLEERKRSPLIYILVIFLILLIVLMAIPYYSVKLDPRPSKIISLDEALVGEILYVKDIDHRIVSRLDFKRFISPEDEFVRNVAVKIVSNGCDVGGNRKVCSAKAIYYFVRNNIQYVGDPDEFEYGETVQDVISTGGSDCDGLSTTLASLLEAVGVDVRLVFIPGHVYVQANLPEAMQSYKSDGNYVSLDATCKTCEFGEVPYTDNFDKEYLEV